MVVVGVAHMKEHFAVALVGIAVEGLHSTSGGFAATAMLAHHTFCVDHAPRETRRTLGSLIGGCGMK